MVGPFPSMLMFYTRCLEVPKNPIIRIFRCCCLGNFFILNICLFPLLVGFLKDFGIFIIGLILEFIYQPESWEAYVFWALLFYLMFPCTQNDQIFQKISYKQLVEQMDDGIRRRQRELLNHDVREHVDWMTRHADQAWRSLERRVRRIEPRLNGIARTEADFRALQEMQRRNHVEIEELRASVHQLTRRSSEFQDNFRDMKIDAQMIKRHTHYMDQNIEELKNNYSRINTSTNTINGNVQELRDQFGVISGEFNRFNNSFQASSEDIREFKNRTDKKITEIGNSLNEIRHLNQEQVQDLKRFMNGELSSFKENVRQQMRNNLSPVTNRMSAVEKQISQCMTKIHENAQLNKGDLKIINRNIETIRREISQHKQIFKNLKNEMEKAKNRQDKLEKLIVFKTDQNKKNIQKIMDQVGKVEEKEKIEREKLEERIHLRIKEETEAMEVLSNKVADLQEKSEGVEELKELKKIKEIKREKKVMQEVQEIQMKGEFEKLVDMETPHVARFLIQANNITLQQFDGLSYQVLLGVVLGRTRPFVLHAHITNNDGYVVAVGVVDRLTQGQESWSSHSGDAVCYYCDSIHYGHNGGHQYTSTGVSLKTGAELRVEVELEKGLATFSVGGSKFTQHSDILSQPHRQFVPFFQMHHKGNSVRWRIE